jgi:hypothetical protein
MPHSWQFFFRDDDISVLKDASRYNADLCSTSKPGPSRMAKVWLMIHRLAFHYFLCSKIRPA